MRAGGRVTFVRHLIIGKELNTLLWRPWSLSSTAQQHEPVLVALGDSYFDDIDMGFLTWPSVLASRRGWSLLNVARGGAESGDIRGQIKRLQRFVDAEGIGPDALVASAVCVVHIGGNDILHRLLPRILFLALDIWRLAAARRARRPALAAVDAAPCSYVGWALQHTDSALDAALDEVARAGFRRVVVLGMPICAPLPLARAVIFFLAFVPWLLLIGVPRAVARAVGLRSTCGTDEGGGSIAADFSSFVRATLLDVAALMTAGVRDVQARFAAARPDVAVAFFDEATALTELNAEHNATSPDKRAAPRFWRDGHHPAAHVHERLAERVGRTIPASWAHHPWEGSHAIN